MTAASKPKRHRNIIKLIGAISLAGVLTLYLSANDLFYSYACYWNDSLYSTPQWNPEKMYKAGIVMGCFGFMDRTTGKIGYVTYDESRKRDGMLPDLRNRLWKAVELWKSGHLEKILITGDMVANFHADGTSDKELFLHYMEDAAGVPPETFLFEQLSVNTHENALFTSEILRQRGLKGEDCLLITSASHIRRSLKCFAKQGFKMDYFAVDARKPIVATVESMKPDREIWGKWNGLMHEWGGEIVYRVKGFI